jgi:dienelactone hydrolase
MTIWSAEIKEIEVLHTSLKDHLPDLEKELAKLIKTDDENIVLIYARRCLEVIVNDLCESELKRPRKTEPLKGIIDKLNREEKVPAHIIASMHSLNSLSTFGAHPKEFDPQQVRPALINLSTILKWYLKYKNIEIVAVSATPEEPEEEKEIIPKEEEIPVAEESQQLQKPDQVKKKKSRDKSLYKKPQVWATSLVVFITVFIVVFQMIYHNRVRWANEKALPEIEQRANELNFAAAFNLIRKADKYISKDPEFRKMASILTTRLTILTDPPGAKIYIRDYSDFEGKWKKSGKTPIDSIEMPNYSFYLMRIEKDGYEDMLAVAPTIPDTFFRKLFSQGTIPEGMVYVEGYCDEVSGNFFNEKNGFFMDRYEVTNKQYKEFVDSGGYRNPEYWKHEFIKDGKILTREEAMAEFTDKTGRPGPVTWEASDYPDGQDDYPVSGVSWYEAAAYAEYAGKSLPTVYHWGSGAGFYFDPIQEGFGSSINQISNFDGKGPVTVGEYLGVGCFGTCDMAGNVREWCWNETQAGHIIRGGAWDDANYMYSNWSQLPSFNRSPKNGFRCVKYIHREKIPEWAFQKIEFSEERNYYEEEPVEENIFRVYKNQFLYDNTALDATIEKRDDSPDDWILEKISFNAAYGNERMIAYLYLPKNIDPPFQTIIFFPGVYALSDKNLVTNIFTNWYIDYIIKNGRAVVYPVYKGTFERNDGQEGIWNFQSHQYTQWLITWTKDVSRTIDYLETRPDIDTSKIAFYGHSWGGITGGIIPAVEERIKLNILITGGFLGKAFPEADQINYVPRIKIPVLMLNGKYDVTFPFESTVKPFYDLLGTPEPDKRLCVYETDHGVPKTDMIRETLAWLDKYFSPPNQ